MSWLVLIAALLTAGPALAEGLLSPLGPVAADQGTHLIRVSAITLIAVLPVLIGVPLILWRYRRGKGAAYRPDFIFSAPLELAMWGVPVLIVGALGYWLWRSTEQLDPYRRLGPHPVQVQVVGLNWKWLFLYPDQGAASIGTLAVPAGRPVQLKLTTDTVMQSFMAPSLAGQIYAMPGMVTELNLMADAPGTTAGANTQFNGAGFAHQTVKVQALSPEDWQAWIEGAGKAPALDARAYAELARPGSLAEAKQALQLSDSRLSLPDAKLFDRIVQRYHRGKPLPASQQPGAPHYRPAVTP
jgi:cytochrome o ubiquinol oxidase subunit 2